ncbi:MAG: hypothetical protein OXG30_10650 [bacterium]|nr:hypothetical protein [bacterium]
MLVEQLFDEAFEAADLAAGCAVLAYERLEPAEAVRAGGCGGGGWVDVFEAAQPALDLAAGGELVAYFGGELGDLVCDVVQRQRSGCYQPSAVLEHRLDLGHERVVGLQRLDGAERRLGQQRPRRGDRVGGVGLVQPTRTALRGRARRGDLAGVEPGGCQSDRDMGAPLCRSLYADAFDAVGAEQADRLAVAGRGVRERLTAGLDAVAVDDADGECVLVGVDSPDWKCHALLLLELMFRWVRDRQGRFVTTESR